MRSTSCPNKIELSGYQFGIGGVISSLGAGHREASSPALSKISVTKQFDSASNKIAPLATNGIEDKDLYEIRFYGTGKGGEPVLT